MMPDVQRRAVSRVIGLEIVKIGLQRLFPHRLVAARIKNGRGIVRKKKL